MRIACNIYKYYGLTQSYKHVTLASSYTHTYSTYTKQGVVCRGFRLERVGYIMLPV